MRRRQLKIRRWFTLGVALGALGFVSSASAIPLVDPGSGPSVSYPQAGFGVNRPPDVQDAATPAQMPDVLERYAAAHPYGAGSTPVISSSDVVRPPDVRDAAYTSRTSVSSASSRFDWGDYGIGIGSGIGATLLLVGGLAVGTQQRRRIQTA